MFSWNTRPNPPKKGINFILIENGEKQQILALLAFLLLNGLIAYQNCCQLSIAVHK